MARPSTQRRPEMPAAPVGDSLAERPRTLEEVATVARLSRISIETLAVLVTPD